MFGHAVSYAAGAVFDCCSGVLVVPGKGVLFTKGILMFLVVAGAITTELFAMDDLGIVGTLIVTVVITFDPRHKIGTSVESV